MHVFDFSESPCSIQLNLHYASTTGYVTLSFIYKPILCNFFFIATRFIFFFYSVLIPLFSLESVNGTITLAVPLVLPKCSCQLQFLCFPTTRLYDSLAEFCCCCSLSKTLSSLCICKTKALVRDLCTLLLNYCHIQQMLS